MSIQGPPCVHGVSSIPYGEVCNTISVVANLDGVAMVAQMNAHRLSGVMTVDVENFGVAW